jgi:hypothetical protein
VNVAPADETPIDERGLRHPLEVPIFIASVILNFVLFGLAVALVAHEPSWVKSHPVLSKEVSFLRLLAVTGLIGIPFLALQRNQREASIRGNSVRLSHTQFPEIYAILEGHCRRLGMTDLPELFITGTSIQPFSQTYSSWHENYIILHQIIFDINDYKTMDVVSFTIAHELGAIRLKQTSVWNEVLLTYVSAIKWLRTPLNRIRTYSRDCYGATLSPTGFRGLLIYAIGRRLMDQVDIEDFLQQARSYGGFWSNVNTIVESRPQVLSRLQHLRAAGFTYKPYVKVQPPA